MVWIMPSFRSKKIQVIDWESNPVILIPKIRPASIPDLLQGYWRHFQCLKRATSFATQQYGPFHIVQVRDDPAMAYVAWRFSAKNAVPWSYQLSHLKEEETMLYCRMHLYGSRLKNLLKGFVGFFLRNFLLRRADLVFPISEKMEKTLAHYCISETSMVPVPEGVDTSEDPVSWDDEAARIREKLKIKGQKVIVYVGTMSRFRQLDFLLESFKLVADQHPDTCLLMVGGDSTSGDTEWLERKAEKLGIEGRVVMTGWVPGKKIPAYIRAGCLGVSPVPINRVYVNSSPIKLLEYLALEIPAVATDIPEQRRVILESGGGICTAWNISEFAGAVSNILHLTEDERIAIGQHGRAWVQKNRDFSILGSTVYEAYRKFLEAPRNKKPL